MCLHVTWSRPLTNTEVVFEEYLKKYNNATTTQQIDRITHQYTQHFTGIIHQNNYTLIPSLYTYSRRDVCQHNNVDFWDEGDSYICQVPYEKIIQRGIACRYGPWINRPIFSTRCGQEWFLRSLSSSPRQVAPGRHAADRIIQQLWFFQQTTYQPL